MKDVGRENQTIFEKYKDSVLNESKKGFRRKVQLLDDRIDDLIDEIEKKIDKIDDNPTFQSKMYQELANTTKEHSEFLMAMKRVASALDSGAKVIASSKGKANPFGGQSKAIDQEPEPNNNQPPEPPQGFDSEQEGHVNEGNTEALEFLDKTRGAWIISLNQARQSMKLKPDRKPILDYATAERKIWDKLVKQLG